MYISVTYISEAYFSTAYSTSSGRHFNEQTTNHEGKKCDEFEIVSNILIKDTNKSLVSLWAHAVLLAER